MNACVGKKPPPRPGAPDDVNILSVSGAGCSFPAPRALRGRHPRTCPLFPDGEGAAWIHMPPGVREGASLDATPPHPRFGAE